MRPGEVEAMSSLLSWMVTVTAWWRRVRMLVLWDQHHLSSSTMTRPPSSFVSIVDSWRLRVQRSLLYKAK
jgi:hypothetical protein